ncbi:hypothetical protein H1R20_g12430, partial [Candolleomyces eurysporus]
MNYIAYHGLVCLYDITMYRFGIANYLEKIPNRVKECYTKYKTWGFEVWAYFEEEHTCKIDGCCPQTIRSLFDNDVVHIRFPDFVEVPRTELRKNEAKLAIWRLSTAIACNALTDDEADFVICESYSSVLRR